jgi:D-alanyl-D-alanine carboxypeptidase
MELDRKRRLIWPCCVAVLLLLSGNAQAGPTMLFDLDTGKVIYAEDQDDLWHPASLTKLMSAYLTFEALKDGRLHLDTKIACSAHSREQPPSKIGMPVNGLLSIDLALRSLIVKSANDVAVMLAEAVGGSEPAFVGKMNATAVRLGMTRTHFANANGLPADDQITTARDLAKLARAVVRDYPEHAHYWAMSELRIGKKRLRSFNGLLKTYVGADGLKTGFTCDSGYNVIASATRDGHRLAAVVLGERSSADRNARAARLLDYGFDRYAWAGMSKTDTVATMQMAPAPRPVGSVRATVRSLGCRRAVAGPTKRRERKNKAGRPVTSGLKAQK